MPLGPKVLVAKKALPVGTIIDADSFTFQPWPKELMQSAYYVEGQPDGDPKKLLGTVVRYPITAGQPVTRGSLVGPQDRGFLAAALGAGMRAITVPVNVSSGVAGFVFPGDHVDLVLTQQVEGGGDGPALKVSETIIRNLRVLATDQRITEQGRRRQDRRSRPSPTSRSKSRRGSPRRSRLRRASARCRCRCARSPTIRPDLERAVAAGDVKVPAGTNPAEEKQMLLAMANRPIDSNTTFSTGGDVSRFQRRTVPARTSKSDSARQGHGQPWQGRLARRSPANADRSGRSCRSRQ